mmetsp:Transcript_35620/g.75062  ORF Transcript_35620/g.75062 Transcript_35620/m.75062 type:complete len:234 (-) Transcript_35620:47-748(-)|eukprot:CAMPEP_0183707956 /NCGR_PEP_ID=MMETSP0737-20130205/4372_1 /TAXON_ID=385413 /ORGANISM="Thalassiosira miniscula, Strain CCMP1093" /LENGTH=233 /DNA_ID=CAMNT_0025935721 /DNA_START=66 /DNA_END=767 /DNA_ORIENTATION=-
MTKPKSSSSSSKYLSPNALSYLTLLLELIENEDWRAFEEIAIQKARSFKALSDIIATTDTFNGMTLLHAVVRSHPPLQIVADIINICPDLPRARDCLNRTPLHLAAGIGASAEVIKSLAVAYPEACKIQDEDGRTPLHLYCDVDCILFEGEKQKKKPPSVDVVHILLSASIVPASMEDNDETSPIEYAIMSDADIRVVKLLQKAAQKFMRKTHATHRQDYYANKMPRQLGAAA